MTAAVARGDSGTPPPEAAAGRASEAGRESEAGRSEAGRVFVDRADPSDGAGTFAPGAGVDAGRGPSPPCSLVIGRSLPGRPGTPLPGGAVA
jgi:hypothetical protein